MLPIYPTTELEAVNEMLSVLGESPLTTLEDSTRVDAVMALNVLRSTSRSVQSQGWTWNTERRQKLALSYPEGYIYLPTNLLRVDSVHGDRTMRVVQRGDRLWDRDNHTYQFEESPELDLVIGLPFDSLPQPARNYITVRAGRVYQERVLGSETLSVFTAGDEREAYEALRHEETENGDFNMRRADPVQRIMER